MVGAAPSARPAGPGPLGGRYRWFHSPRAASGPASESGPRRASPSPGPGAPPSPGPHQLPGEAKEPPQGPAQAPGRSGKTRTHAARHVCLVVLAWPPAAAQTRAQPWGPRRSKPFKRGLAPDAARAALPGALPLKGVGPLRGLR